MEILDISLIPDGVETRVGEGKCQITVRHDDGSVETLYSMAREADDFLAQCLDNREPLREINRWHWIHNPKVILGFQHESGNYIQVEFHPH